MAAMQPRKLAFVAPLAAAAALVLARCGAEGTPAPPSPPPPASCGSVEELAPTLWDMIQGSEASEVGALVEALQAPIGADERKPLPELLRVVLAILRDYGQDPPEAGGDPCGHGVPPRGEPHHRTCMLQRLLDPSRGGEIDGQPLQLAVAEALRKLAPLAGNLFGYMLGAPPFDRPAYDEDGDGDPMHFALVDLVRHTCQEDAVCGVGGTLDLLVAMVDYAATPLPGTPGGGCADPTTVGERLFCAAEGFVLDPGFDDWWTLLDFHSRELNERGQPKGRAGFLALVGLFLGAIDRAEDDPAAGHAEVLAQLAFVRQSIEAGFPDGTLLGSYDRLVLEVDLMLHPDRGVIVPLQRALACLESADRRARRAEEERIGRPLPEGQLLLVAVHSFLFADPEAPPLSLEGLVRDVKVVLTLDPDGVLLAVIADLLHAVRDHGELYSEPTAPLPASCKIIFEREAAARLVPLLRDLLESRLLEETMCVLDVLLYGCAGGERPAPCGSVPSPSP